MSVLRAVSQFFRRPAPAEPPRLRELRDELKRANRKLHESYEDWWGGFQQWRLRFTPGELGMFGPGLGFPADRRTDRTHGPLPFMSEPAWRLHLAFNRDLLSRNHLAIGFLEHVAEFVGNISVQFVRRGQTPGPAASGPVDADSDGMPDAAPEVQMCTEAWEAWCEANDWGMGQECRQRESRVRDQRDGNVLLRFFRGGRRQVPVTRFVEPEQLQTPPGETNTGPYSFGKLADSDDAERIVSYWITKTSDPASGQEVPANRIVHKKRNVDRWCKVGLSDFFPCSDSLGHTTRLLESMAIVANVQAKIAWWEFYTTATRDQVQGQIEQNRDYGRDKLPFNPFGSPHATSVLGYEPGTVPKTDANREILPGPVSEPGGFLDIEAAILRGVGFRFGAPEFFAGSGEQSFAGLLVAGSPFARIIGGRQEQQIGFVREVVMCVLRLCEESGRLPEGITERVKPILTATPVVIADEEKQARTELSLMQAGLADPYKIMKERGDDPKVVLANLAAFHAKMAQMQQAGRQPGGGAWTTVHGPNGVYYRRANQSGGQPPGGTGAGMTPSPPGSAGGDGTSGLDAIFGEGRVAEGAPGPAPRPGLVWNDGTHRWRNPETGEEHPHEPAADPKAAYEAATPAARKFLDTAYENAEVTPGTPPADPKEARLLARFLVGSWLEAPRLNLSPEDTASLERAMSAAVPGLAKIHAPGESVPFDGEHHESKDALSTGQPVQVVRPGWSLGRRLIVKAEVQKG